MQVQENTNQEEQPIQGEQQKEVIKEASELGKEPIPYYDQLRVRKLYGADWTNLGVTTFTGLTDVPDSYSGQTGKTVKVNSGGTALEFASYISTFLGLSDTPSSFSGSGSKTVKVNSGATALEFATAGMEQVAFGSGTSPSTTGTQNISVGFTPKIFIIFAAEAQSTNTSSGVAWSIGVANGTADENNHHLAVARNSNNEPMSFVANDTCVLYELDSVAKSYASASAFGSTVTLSWTVDGSGLTMNYFWIALQ